MLPLTVALPELEQFPLERRKAIIESFNTSTETAALRERLSKLPFRLAAVIVIVVIGVMVLIYDVGAWRCMLAGLLCFAVGVPLGLLIQMELLRRAFRQYVQNRSTESG